MKDTSSFLVIDASSGLKLALFSNEESSEAVYRSYEEQKVRKASVPFYLDLLRADHSSLWNQLKRVYICLGEGSYSGIKIGYMIGETLGLACSLSVQGYYNFELLRLSGQQKQGLWLSSAHKGEFFWYLWDNTRGIIQQELLSREQLEKRIIERSHLFSTMSCILHYRAADLYSICSHIGDIVSWDDIWMKHIQGVHVLDQQQYKNYPFYYRKELDDFGVKGKG